MRTRSFTPANRESNDPQDEKDRGRNPQEVHGESGPEKDQDEQQCEYQ